MADSSVAITPGPGGAPIRVLTALGAGSAGQQVMTLGDSAGNLLGTPAAPFPVQDYDITGSGTITTVDAASATATSTVAGVTVNRITGTPTAASTVTLTISGESSFAVDVSGTWTGTLQFERTVDNVTWTDVAMFVAGAPVTTKTTTANGAFHGNASAAMGIRVRATAAMTGTATVTIRTGSGAGTITIGNPLNILASPTLSAVNTTTVPATPGGVNTVGHAAATITAAVTTAAAFISAPAAGLSIYITDINMTNVGTAATTVALFAGSATVPLAIRYANSTTSIAPMSFKTPVRVGTATALNYTSSTATTSLYVQITYYVAV